MSAACQNTPVLQPSPPSAGRPAGGALDAFRSRVHAGINHPGLPLGLALLHVALALYEYGRGLNFTFHPDRPERAEWDWYWQVLSRADLLERPWQSLWHLHAQPPAFSLWAWLWLHLCGSAHFPASLQFGYILMGGAVVAMTFELALALTASRPWALAAGLLMALNPAVFLYEAYLLYDIPVVFLLTATAWCLWRGLTRGRRRWLALMILALNALVLTRSLFHLVFIPLALAFAWPLWRELRPGRRWAWLALALLLPLAWYGKNMAQVGFFGSSSWFGLGWFRCVGHGYSSQELLALSRRGVIPEMTARFSPYQHTPDQYRVYGFTRQSDVPLLARNDWHNVNVPAISAAYGRAALRLIELSPWRYARAIHDSYIKFCQPPARFEHLDAARYRYVFWEPLAAGLLYGKPLTEELELFTRIELGSLFYFIFPALILGGALWAWAARRRPGVDRAGRHRARLMAYLLFASLYVAAVICLFEDSENMRYRFYIEPLTLVIALTLVRSLVLLRKGTPPDQPACAGERNL